MADVAQATADNTAQVAALFHHGVDVLAGLATSDDAAAWIRVDGLSGPANSGQGFYVGADGRLYPRGQGGASMPNVASNAVKPSSEALTLSPGLLMLGVLAFLLLRK